MVSSSVMARVVLVLSYSVVFCSQAIQWSKLIEKVYILKKKQIASFVHGGGQYYHHLWCVWIYIIYPVWFGGAYGSSSCSVWNFLPFLWLNKESQWELLATKLNIKIGFIREIFSSAKSHRKFKVKFLWPQLSDKRGIYET